MWKEMKKQKVYDLNILCKKKVDWEMLHGHFLYKGLHSFCILQFL